MGNSFVKVFWEGPKWWDFPGAGLGRCGGDFGALNIPRQMPRVLGPRTTRL
jgi:hypothetical protein